LGKGCKIANSEIKNTIVLEHSNIPHFSYVGDSIIGRDVNLGAGTKIANLRFDGKAISVTLHGDKVDSGRRKLGALIHDGTKIGINASINCGVILPKHSKVLPGQVVMGGNNSSKS
jgi:bifunctional UDP-N-acetylglucosamine pyrophosphorylase/glucosamine-1-phosphate N-acetyltransferase